MKILLINVHFEQDLGLLRTIDPLMSLTLRQLAAITPKKHEIDILENIFHETIDYDKDYDLIGISTVTPSAFSAYEIADEFRKRGKKVVLGGYHPSALPNEAIQHADSVVIGEGELVWPELLADAENGKIKPYYRSRNPIDPCVIPNPERKNYGKKIYVSAVMPTRGCPVGCEFCSIGSGEFGHIFRKKPVEKIIEDIKSIKEKYIFFAAPSLTIDTEYTKKLFRGLKGLNKKLTYCQGNANVLLKDDELLKLASEAGCIYWHIGFESISQKTLDSVGKMTNKVDDYVKVIKKINDYGMAVFGEFVFGFDTDTPDVFEKTEEVIRNWNINPGFQILVPYPGSRFFNRLDEEGRILTRDWSKYTTRNAVFQPKHMSVGELEGGVNRLITNFYSYPRSIKRIFKSIKLGFYPFFYTAQINIGGSLTVKQQTKIYEKKQKVI